MKAKDLDFEALFSQCFAALIEDCNGSIEAAMDELGVYPDERPLLREWFGWDDEDDPEVRDDETLKELFQDVASQYDECDDIEDALSSLMDAGELSDEEFDIIQEHWDEWLPEE